MKLKKASLRSTDNFLELFEYSDSLSGIRLTHIPYSEQFKTIFMAFAVPFGAAHGIMPVGPLHHGAAHYLEHCLFSQKVKPSYQYAEILTSEKSEFPSNYYQIDNGNVMLRLDQYLKWLKADVNAQTTNTHTIFYATCRDNRKEIFKTYLKALLNAHIDEEQVERERGIILSELQMYKDDPDAEAYQELMKSLYSVHPIREDICGTDGSIRQITAVELNKICDEIYTPQNIEITLAGNISEDEINEWLTEVLDESSHLESSNRTDDFQSLKCLEKSKSVVYPEEKSKVHSIEKYLYRDVAVPSFYLACKIPIEDGTDPVKRIQLRDSVDLWLQTYVEEGSSIFQELYNDGLITRSFSTYFDIGRDYAHIIFSSESPDPVKAVSQLETKIIYNRVSSNDGEALDAEKRASVGRFLMNLDSVYRAGMEQVRAGLAGINLIDTINLQQSTQALNLFEKANVQGKITKVFMYPRRSQ